MYRKLITLSLLATVCGGTKAQMLNRANEALDTLCLSRFTAVYQYSINTQDAEDHPVTDSIRLALQVGDGVWKTWAYERYLYQCHRDEEIGDDRYAFQLNEALMHVATTTVGYPEGQTSSIESMPPLQYEVKEDTEKPAWSMKEGEDSISGYMCRKAVGEFRGKKWDVLYAEDIPSVAGPWKLQGLPGLITYAMDAKGIHTFRLIAVYQDSVPITRSRGNTSSKFSVPDRRFLNIVTPFEKSSREQMMKHKKKVFGSSQYLRNPMFYMTGPKEIFHTYGASADANYQFVGGLLVPEKGHKYQPLELE